eukprot:gnl/TRDRNA2_/TRDRNA2_157363_c0_seq3.p1 gnl/TRDRNA2_/TRDRNA2_157363_c0~~gnl/TRDRNA2_/TRDRNA2_157363_c0_seq3.p1  ORF type:complete len:260 (+),score=53.65 gnl/TRDRNA2_/TRDRNA2_157363_c0_seq3:238-1017(+)
MNAHYSSLRGEEVVRSQANPRRWTVPTDEGALKRLASATSSSAAAAAFLAAESAARRRHAESSDNAAVGTDKEVWYPWRDDGVQVARNFSEAEVAEAQLKTVSGETGYDFSMFHKDVWQRTSKRAEDLLAEQQAGAFCYRESMPRPQSKVPGCSQAKVRHVQVNTEEKAVRAYQAMAAGGGSDRNGFLLGCSMGRFVTLAKDKSYAPEGKNGGDLGWVAKGKLDPKLEEVIFSCPRGACSPPFRTKLACFHLVYVEDRR